MEALNEVNELAYLVFGTSNVLFNTHPDSPIRNEAKKCSPNNKI